MKFHYTAFQPDGRSIEGDIEARDTGEVLNILGRQGLRPLSVKPADSAGTKARKNLFEKRLTIGDRLFMTKYLGLMLKVGTDLFKAIDILIADFDKPVVRSLMMEIKANLEKGQPFHSTFEKYPRYFSPVFVNLVKAGEASGGLDRIFSELSVSLQKEYELRSRIRSALTYPVILLSLATIILFFLVTFAIPKIADIFSGGSFEPPLFSRIVFTISAFLNTYVWWFAGAILVCVGIVIFMLQTASGKVVLRRVLAHTPIVRNVVRQVALQRFAATLSSLLQSGISIVTAIEITAGAVGEDALAGSLRRIAREGISKGLTLGDAFKRESAFPSVVANLVAVSERAGHLDEILKTLGDFYEAQIDSSLKTLVSFIEPVLLLFIGGVIGGIALSIIVPIYQLVGQF